jgi:hypothetical protein
VFIYFNQVCCKNQLLNKNKAEKSEVRLDELKELSQSPSNKDQGKRNFDNNFNLKKLQFC